MLTAGETVALVDGEGVPLNVPVPVLLPVFEALAPCDKDGVGDTVREGDSDDDGVSVAEIVGEADGVNVADGD